MVDIFDVASEREEEMRADALAEHARRADGAACLASAPHCACCGVAIPPARRRIVPGVQTCVDCQRRLERAGDPRRVR